MALDLETIRAEMLSYLQANDFAVFHGYSRIFDALPFVYWDVDHHPDFRAFLDVAGKAGVKLVVFHYRAFTLDQIDDALERLEQTTMTSDEKRSFEIRLRELQPYEGFTCTVELTFDHEGRIYIFELRTDWYENLADILAEIDGATDLGDDDEEDNGDSRISGYYSRN
jgi:hypothetical protein